MNRKVQVTLGSYAQSEPKYGSSAGKQCTAMSLAFAIYTRSKRVDSLRQKDLDNILDIGNDIYVPCSNFYKTELLAPEEIPIEVNYKGVKYGLKVGQFRYGFIGDVRNLTYNLTNAFCMYQDLFFVCKGKTSFIQYNNGHYYLYDSHKKDKHGNVHADGKSSLMKFTEFYEMIGYLASFYHSVNREQYDIVPLNVTQDVAKSSSPNHVNCVFRRRGARSMNVHETDLLSTKHKKRPNNLENSDSSGTEGRQKKRKKKNDDSSGTEQTLGKKRKLKPSQGNGYEDVVQAAKCKKRNAEICVVGPNRSVLLIDNEPVDKHIETPMYPDMSASQESDNVGSQNESDAPHITYKRKKGKWECLNSKQKEKEKKLPFSELQQTEQLKCMTEGQEKECLTLYKMDGVWKKKDRKKKKTLHTTVSTDVGKIFNESDIFDNVNSVVNEKVMNETTTVESVQERPNVNVGQENKIPTSRPRRNPEPCTLSTSGTETDLETVHFENFAIIKKRLIQENPNITEKEIDERRREHRRLRDNYNRKKRRTKNKLTNSSQGVICDPETSSVATSQGIIDNPETSNVSTSNVTTTENLEDFRLIKKRAMQDNPNITESEISAMRKEHQRKRLLHRREERKNRLTVNSVTDNSESEVNSDTHGDALKRNNPKFNWYSKKKLLLAENPNLTAEELDEAKKLHQSNLKKMRAERYSKKKKDSNKGKDNNSQKVPMIDVSFLNTHYGNPCSSALSMQQNITFNPSTGCYELRPIESLENETPNNEPEVVQTNVTANDENEHIQDYVNVENVNSDLNVNVHMQGNLAVETMDQNIDRNIGTYTIPSNDPMHQDNDPMEQNNNSQIFPQSHRGNDMHPNIAMNVQLHNTNTSVPSENGNIEVVPHNHEPNHMSDNEHDVHSVNSELLDREFNIDEEIDNMIPVNGTFVSDFKLKKLNEGISGTCKFCCKLCFSEQGSIISEALQPRYAMYIPESERHFPLFVCNSCKAQINRKRIPKFSQYGQGKFPVVVPDLEINPREERLIALRIPFMHIRILPTGGQQSLRGNVINVPADINDTIYQLPRHINDNGTVTVKLKRKLEYTSVYEHSNVRPLKVLRSLQWLLQNSVLYKNGNIEIDSDWLDKAIQDLEGDSNFTYSSNDPGIVSRNDNTNNVVLQNINDNISVVSTSNPIHTNLSQSSVDHMDLENLEIADLENVLQITEHDNGVVSNHHNDLHFENDIHSNSSIETTNQNNTEQNNTEQNLVFNIDSNDVIGTDAISSSEADNELYYNNALENRILPEVPQDVVQTIDSNDVVGTDAQSDSDAHNDMYYNRSIENQFPFESIGNNENIQPQNPENAEGHDEDDESDDNFSEIDHTEVPVIHDTLIDIERPDAELQVAPGQGQIPLNILYDNNAEELCFPTIYCGQPISDFFPTNVSFLARTRWEMQCSDRRVACKPEIIFLKYKRYQMEYVRSQAQFSMRFVPQSAPYKAKDVKTSDDRQQIATVDNGFYFFRKLRNSPQYLQQKKRDLFATIRQLGLPTFFVSLSAADTRWKELLKTLGQIVDKRDYTDAEINDMSYVDKTRLINGDPVTCARYFDHRFQFFLKHVLYKPPYPLGRISHHFYRVEFQHRGAPHIHMIIFSDTAPKYKRGSPNSDVCNYIDKYISCSLTPHLGNEEFLKFQIHKHSKTCRKGGRPQCRFHYPLPPFDHTTILCPNSERTEEQIKMYKDIQQFLDSEQITENTTLEDILNHFNISFDQYVLVVRANLKHEQVFLKRKPYECRVNMYMKNLLQVWEANMDCQFCLDPYSVVQYIVNYINKENRGLSLNLQQMTKQCEREKKSIRDTIKKLGNVFCNTSEICVQEAAYVLLGIALTYQSIDVVRINSAPPEKRTKLLRNEKELEQLADNSTDIYQKTVFEIYADRPLYFEDFSFADYVSMVKITPRTEASKRKETVGFHNTRNTQYYLDEEKRYSIGRRRILSFICPPKDKDKEEYYRIHILLYLPWRQEPQLHDEHSTFTGLYHILDARQQYRIMENAKLYNKQKMDELHDIYADMSNDTSDLVLQPNTDQQNSQDLELGSTTLNGGTFFQPVTQSVLERSADADLDAHINSRQTLYNINQRWPLEVILNSVQKLNQDQRSIYDHIMKNILTSTDKMYIFISGGAGTGKTFLLQTLYQSISRMYNLSANNTPDIQKVLKLANTGKAAFLIKGKTIHGGLSIMPKESYENYDRLPADKLNTLHVKFRQTKAIMFDEVSLIGTRLFRYIDLRLQEIMGILEPFGGLHIFCFGDLYQLPPVKDKWIFENTRSGMSTLAINQWTERFQLYELNEIMRQRDEQSFAELLNRMRINELTRDDLSKLEERCIDQDEYNDGLTCLHLFGKNNSAQNYNASIFSRANTYKEVVEAVDTLVDNANADTRKKVDDKLEKDDVLRQGTSRYLKLGIGLTYEVTANINIEDGITNGTAGILRFVQHREGFQKPICLWMELEEPEIGQVQRQIYRHYRTDGISRDWTPIFPNTIEFRMTDPKAKVRRKQFPLMQSTGKTVHKAQGMTIPEVAIALNDHTFRNAFYVACSRVPLISRLHIIKFSISQICPDKKVAGEMLRLQAERPLKLNFEIFPNKTVSIDMYYANIQSLYSHFKYVEEDVVINQAHIIMFNETHLQPSDDNNLVRFPGYRIYRYDAPIPNNAHRPSNGLIIYVQDQYDVYIIKKKRTKYYEYMCIEVQNNWSALTVVLIYIKPNTTKHNIGALLLELFELLQAARHTVIFGDFNIDLQEEVNLHYIQSLVSEHGFVLNRIGISTKGETELDFNISRRPLELCSHFQMHSYHMAITSQYLV